jgi:hypothetical protein
LLAKDFWEERISEGWGGAGWKEEEEEEEGCLFSFGVFLVGVLWVEWGGEGEVEMRVGGI